ncbi:MAG TPA: pitrilysin family protein [Acidobacteriota bacterium]|nr:pitrilysin family protein [Acidobacteriota bacterium]
MAADRVQVTLDNGLRVVVQPLHSAPLVSVWCWYHVGSKNEVAGLTGASHFVEHMNFKGTPNISREDLKVWIERAGGSWNGYTWIDQTTYFETLAADQLDLALKIEADRMTECLYEPDEFESERTVVLAEMHGNSNSPEYLLDVDVTAAALRMHPYRWPTIGWQSDLEMMSRDDLLAHYRQYYHPGNATLVVAGDVDADTAVDAARRRFGGIRAAEMPTYRRVSEPRQDGERRVVLERPGTTGYLQVVYPAPAFTDAGFVPMLLADALLSGGKGINLWSGGFGRSARITSPLYASLVDSELVVSISSAVLPTEEPYLYGLSATLRDGVEPRRAEQALAGSVEGLAVREIDDRALRKAKNQVLSALAFESERITDVAHQLGYFATIATVDALDAVPGSVEATTTADVRRAASRFLQPEARTVGWSVPRRDS